MRILSFLLGMLLAGVALAQPDILPPPPPNQPQQAQALVEIMKAADAAITALAKDTLASKRLEKITEEGLIVAPFALLLPDGGDGDGFTTFVVSWVQEKTTNAMIKEDGGGHFAVIDRAFIDKAIREMKLDAKALADPTNWPAIGQATGAKYMVTGSIGIIPLAERPLSLSFSLTARIVSVEDGKAVAAGDADFLYPEKK
jgi:hypothetical protein